MRKPILPLLKPHEVDHLLRLLPGRAERWAKRGLLPCVALPNGDIRFRREDIERIVSTATQIMRKGDK